MEELGFFDKIVKPFWDSFGDSFLTLILIGLIIGVLVKITVKKFYDSKIEKTTDETKIAKLKDHKAFVSLVVGCALSVYGAVEVQIHMPLPTECFIIWSAFVYIVQYLTSMYLVKVIVRKCTQKAERPAKIKPRYAKFEVDENGNPIK